MSFHLRHFLSYNRRTGNFIWRRLPPRPGRARLGAIAGTITKRGYIAVGIGGQRYLAHQLAWFFVYGEWRHDLDHKNGDRTDNRIVNLRPSTIAQNQHNARLRLDNRSGVKGVSWDSHNKRWRAQIGLRGRTILIGRFRTVGEAAEARAAAANEMHGEFARLR
jgi:hypothetical protein